MLPSSFDPAVRHWFETSFDAATACQTRAWNALEQGKHTLVAAPTGSGKTLAAFLTAISTLAARARVGQLGEQTVVLYVSPLKALSNDIRQNLEQPLAAIHQQLSASDSEITPIKTAVRTGDTPASARAHMRKKPPHILVTTPESLYILLTSDSGREMLRSVETVIIDEIHALVGNKRGAHLSLSLARLENLCDAPLVRVGLSATQRPINRVADYLTGGATHNVACEVIDEGHLRAREISIEMPESPLETVLSAEVSAEIRERLCDLIAEHRTTLIFVNTRRMAERLARALADRLGDDEVCAHHGSMSRDRRFDAERRLKNGQLKALVATASLELGIDIGDIDLVCQLGATRSLAMLLQRVGRSGHAIDGIARGRLFPQTRDELLECITLLDMVKRDELDSIEIPLGPRDVLAQQIVAELSCEDYTSNCLFELFKRAWPYRNLRREDFDRIVAMLGEGYSLAHGRRAAYLHVDAINGRLRARRGARLVAVTCGGAIPDTADYDVIAEPRGEMVGTVNEDFAIESLPGNIFQLGNTSWRVLRVESSGVRVEDAAGEPPNMPFWLGEAPARSSEFSAAVSRLRIDLEGICQRPGAASSMLAEHLESIPGIGSVAARQAGDYVFSAYQALGAMPSQQTLVMERFFDESGGMQLVIHSPFGSRLNKAWGLALRKRFCRTFNFELQAAAVEDAIVLSLGTVHSFELTQVWRYLSAVSVRGVLTQALLDSPMFNVRWRWVAACALAIQRFRGGKKTPPRLIRMQAEDLVASVFPDQLACAENLSGLRDVPEHPLVDQAIDDCLHEAMDVVALEGLLTDMERGSKTLIARDLTEPSPFALQVLNANPYAFLDDAPLEERRTQAVSARRWLDPDTARDLGDLDQAAIERVRDEVWPRPRDAEELHEALLLVGFVTAAEAEQLGLREQMLLDLERLLNAGRVVRIEQPSPGWAATERLAALRAIWPALELTASQRALEFQSGSPPSAEEALQALLRGRLEMTGPSEIQSLVKIYQLGQSAIEAALAALESSGIVLKGHYEPQARQTQWCDRRLLARIHRYTLGRLRSEIEPVSSSVLMQFLFRWQHLTPATRMEGSAGLLALIEQFSGFEAPASAWESELLPRRMKTYQSSMLDQLVSAGRCAWLRLTPKKSSKNRLNGTVRNTPLAVMPRTEMSAWLEHLAFDRTQQLSAAADRVAAHIEQRGASFFDEIVDATGLLPSQCEQAMDELAAAGLLTCDSFAGLRALAMPPKQRHPRRSATRGSTAAGIAEAGRWAAVKRPSGDSDTAITDDDDAMKVIALGLLRRYGVVFRALMARESGLPPWRYLLWTLRRMEARGEVRGGRFVAGFSGEQFALPEAVSVLREARRGGPDDSIVVINATDPLNLVGLIVPGERIAAVGSNQLAFYNGELAGIRSGNEFQTMGDHDAKVATKIRTALVDQRLNQLPPRRRRWR